MANLTDQWIPLLAARAVSGLSETDIRRHVAEGRIRTKPTEGCRGRFLLSREDLLRVAGILR